jgi:DNA-binding phage protein
MIESGVKATQRWKGLNLSALDIRVTDRADLTGWICKLLCVTARARCMSSFARQGWLWRVVLATMAKQTGKPSVIAIVVFEL